METIAEWTKVEEVMHTRFSKKADLKAILFVIGMREFGQKKKKFTKEQKQDLMNLAVCKIMSLDGYFIIKNYDDEGWPMWTQVKPLPQMDTKKQEEFLKQNVINYFRFEKLID